MIVKLKHAFSADRGWQIVVPAAIYRGCLKVVLATLTVSLTAACATNAEIPVSSVYQSQHCAISQSGLIFLDSPEQLYGFVESARKFQLTEHKAELVPPGAEGRAIVVAWGNHPNAGYRLELTGDVAVIDEDTLNLPVSFVTPGQDQLSAQLITSPCLVVSVASREGYQQVRAGELQAAIPAAGQ